MKSLILWTDPHLGVSSSSHTTANKRPALHSAILAHLREILPLNTPNVCLGDLFHTFSNDERIIADVVAILSEFGPYVLAGNHDSSNRDSAVSSLSLLSSLGYFEIADGICTDTVSISDDGFETAELWFIPHEMTQERFEESLTKAQYSEKPQCYAGTCKRILLLHCNYGSPFTDTDISLNLTRERASQLLAVFDYIFIGHEHQPREDFDGRLIVLGNVHPTSFADISDKFIYELTSKGVHKTLVWSKETKHLKIAWQEVGEAPGNQWVQFIDVDGTAPAELLPQVSRDVAKLWDKFPSALLIRNNVITEGVSGGAAASVSKAESIEEAVSARVSSTELSPLWAHYLAKAKGV